ncbi:FG-GAP-like repeat-containing protein [Streptomyces atratus]|uniref:FG-GAP-like repeat-containing protein n=1 Tax=Streptomyces atratus TaxID=1893 RepID=UPI002AC34CDF|nr:FG-GAP-like repeat-containing protein [Streptomyces atratus]WPW27922.1 FG-GAP-like repeat-containing protein [Streptomyces atratus]
MRNDTGRGRGRSSVLALGLLVTLSTLGTGLGIAATASDPDSGEAGRGVEVSPLAKAKSSGEPVEIVERRTETSEVHANPSGTLTVTTHLSPVRVRQGGKWVAVDTDLVVGKNRVTPKAAAAGIELSDGGTGPLVRLNDDMHVLEYSWPGKLPKPRLAGAVATYPEVMPGVDLQVEVNAKGFQQLLVVKDAKAAKNPELRKLTYGMKSNGLKVTADEKQGLKAADAKGRTTFSGPAPRMWDSGKGTKKKQAVMETTAAGESLTVVPDQKLLTDTGTTYPVYVGPSFSTELPGAYAVHEFSPEWQHWDTERLWMGNYKGTDGKFSRTRSFFQVDVPYLAGRQVLNASLSLKDLSGWTGDCSLAPVELWETGRAGATTTWNNQPLWKTKNSSYSCPKGTVTLGATSAAQAAAQSGTSLVDLGVRTSLTAESAKAESTRQFLTAYAKFTVEIANNGECFLVTDVSYTDPDGRSFTKEMNCGSLASDVKAEPYTTAQSTGQLLAGPHGFVCWRSGDMNGAGNRIWYYVKGDTASGWTGWRGWGFVPADKITGVGAEPYPGLPACGVYNVTPGITPPQDFNSDGLSDVVALQADGNLALHPGIGNGTLGSKRMLWTDGRGSAYTNVFTGDFNGDGIGDIGGFGGGRVWWWAGDGNSGVGTTAQPLMDNRYKTQAGFDPGLHAPCRVAFAADFNGDGKTDIAAACGQGSEQGNYDDDAIWWWPGDGDGGINATLGASPGYEYLYAWRSETEFSPLDVTGDGRMDIARMASPTVLELNPGPLARDASYGTGTRQTWAPNGFGTVTKVFAGDFNGDRYGDMAGVDSSGRLWQWPGKGDGTFGAPSKMSTATDWGAYKDLL